MASIIPHRFNPLESSRAVLEDYKRYLNSTWEFSDREIRDEFKEALDSRIELGRGPFIQSSPPYAAAGTIADLVADGVLDPLFLELDSASLPVNRSLYAHQEKAIRKLASGRNLIIATGTGSGKTESFLIPIINHLMGEIRARGSLKPGVRAMLLYPMNALANDQLGRIREILKVFPQITFGRYIGETKLTHEEALIHYRERFERDPEINELISREQMRSEPPHILVTNYSMLEYLLLRPEDHEFFDGANSLFWRFIILDEVHSYQGAQGAELALLLRRVKERVAQSQRGRILFAGTSATLGKGIEDMPELVRFGESLFNERVEFISGSSEEAQLRQDVISPDIDRLGDGHEPWTASAVAINEMAEVVVLRKNATDLAEIATSSGYLGFIDSKLSLRELCGFLMVSETHVSKLRDMLIDSAHSVEDAAAKLFDESDGQELLEKLVLLSTFGVATKSGAPALGVKFHLMLRALEGAFRCISPLHPKDRPRLQLKRYKNCPECEVVNYVSPMFELGRCKGCGNHYIVGAKDESEDLPRLRHAEYFSKNLLYYLPKEFLAVDEDEDEVTTALQDSESSGDLDTEVGISSWLCASCGHISENSSGGCGHNRNLLLEVVGVKAKDGVLFKCASCNTSGGGPVVERVLSSKDYPASVIAGALYQQLPIVSDSKNANELGGGRKLLCFADSRQDAAWFATFFDNRYSRMSQRNLIYRVLKELTKPVSFEGLVTRCTARARSEYLVDMSRPQDSHRDKVAHWLMREVIATDKKQSLHGTGLAKISVVHPIDSEVPVSLTELGFNDKDALTLMDVFLGFLRDSGAVKMPDGVNISDPMFAPRKFQMEIRLEASDQYHTGWIPRKASNRRLDYLVRLVNSRADRPLSQDETKQKCRRALERVWTENLGSRESRWNSLLLKREHYAGVRYAIDPQQILFTPGHLIDLPKICEKCRQISWSFVDELCPTYRCGGQLKIFDSTIEENYFRSAYKNSIPAGMRVEEHTAQLAPETATRIQDDFVSGKINVLSCSTTFELGVDVGDIQAVFMRNVPPSPANYIQRAGRAGRRIGTPALAVTFANRAPHDLYFYQRPLEMINGHLMPPLIRVSNIHIVRRHAHAVAYAAFSSYWVKKYQSRSWPKNVEEFFCISEGETLSVKEEFAAWLKERPNFVGEALNRIIPEDLQGPEALGLADWNWVEALFEEVVSIEKSGWMRKAEQSVLDELQHIDDGIAFIKKLEGDTNDRKKLKILSMNKTQHFRRRETVTGEQLLGYLGKFVVIPKYGFPVDVINLDVRRFQKPGTEGIDADKVELSRDAQLGIGDFAPGSKTTALKSFWESVGIYIPIGKVLTPQGWCECRNCGAFWETKGMGRNVCAVCSSDENVEDGKPYIQPRYGFIGIKSKEIPGEFRPSKVGYLESLFSDFEGQPPEPIITQVLGLTLHVRRGRQGRITVLNRGDERRGFEWCNICGFARPMPRKKKERRSSKNKNVTEHNEHGVEATGRTCKGRLSHITLGHWYLTDAIEIGIPAISMTRTQASNVLAALVSALNVIGVGPREMNSSLRPRKGGYSLVLFDAVSGGAGYATSAADNLETLFKEAHSIASHCPDCGSDTACYGCLRSYQNQRDHNSLERRIAIEILEKFPGLSNSARTGN